MDIFISVHFHVFTSLVLVINIVHTSSGLNSGNNSTDVISMSTKVLLFNMDTLEKIEFLESSNICNEYERVHMK